MGSRPDYPAMGALIDGSEAYKLVLEALLETSAVAHFDMK